VRQQHFGKLCRGQHRRFDMHMPVDEGRRDIFAPGIHHSTAAVSADSDDEPIRNGNISLNDFSVEDIDDFTVGDHGIRRFFAGSDSDSSFICIQKHFGSAPS